MVLFRAGRARRRLEKGSQLLVETGTIILLALTKLVDGFIVASKFCNGEEFKMSQRVHELVKCPSQNKLAYACLTKDPDVMVFISTEDLRFECPRIWRLYNDNGIENIEGTAFDPEDPEHRQRRFNATFDYNTMKGTLQFIP